MSSELIGESRRRARSYPYHSVTKRKESALAGNEPVTELDPRYGDKGATATRWSEVRKQLEDAELFELLGGLQRGRGERADR